MTEDFKQDTEQQLVNGISTDHVGNYECSILKLECVKEEAISETDQNVSEAVQIQLTDSSVKNEFVLNVLQPVNEATSESSDHGLKLPHTQVSLTVKHQVKHETDLASAVNATIDEVDQLASKPNSFVTRSENAEPARGSKGSSCANVSSESALQQIVAGCYVKLQRLRLLQCDVCEKMFHKYSSLRTHYTDSHVTRRFNIVQAKSVRVQKPATNLANIVRLHPCGICNEKFTFKADMLLHKCTTKLANANVHKCDLCNLICPFKVEMLIHKLKHTNKEHLALKINKSTKSKS